jgi:hypothetical protein
MFVYAASTERFLGVKMVRPSRGFVLAGIRMLLR